MATKFRKKAVLTQGNAGATDVELTIANDGASPMRVDFLSLGKDNYAAKRTITAELRSGTTPIGLLLPAAGVGVDNQFLPLVPSRGQENAIPINGNNLSADATIRANTAGQILWVYSITVTVYNTSVAAAGLWAVRDGSGGTILCGGVAPIAVTTTPVQPLTATYVFPKPVPVYTGLYWDTLGGTLVADVSASGVEEAGDTIEVLEGAFTLAPGDKVYLKAAQLAQNETLTAWARGEGDDLAIANASGAGVTIATTSE